jgi:DNA polymerase elongation subunit (family B)
MNKTQKMKEQILQHGNNLNAIFETKFDSLTLCRKLFRLERKANFAATCLCNTNTLHLLELNKYTGYNVEQATEEQQDKFFEDILNKVNKILNFRAKNIPVFINYDARGYALKIKAEYSKNIALMTDWGGYGIIAPDFRN